MPLLAQAPLPPAEWWEPIAFAAFGSFAAGAVELFRAYMLPGPRRRVVKDPISWAYRLVVMPAFAAGVGFAYLRAGHPLTALLAIQVGASTPLLLQAFLSPPPAPEAGPPAGQA